MDLKALAAEFPRDAVHWRAQSITKAGDKALALAYLDARDVMDRLDEVCGPSGWQTEISETAKGRVICRLGIHTENGWVWKSDGAGNTDVEGEKGGISDAIKRAAVSWGIGRYLYRIKSPWVPCETYNGKWSKWTANPWDHVRGSAPKAAPPPPVKRDPTEITARIINAIDKAALLPNLQKVTFSDAFKETFAWLETEHPGHAESIRDAQTRAMARIDPAGQAPDERAA